MNKTIALASLLALALGVPAAEAAKFYKWTDDKGVTHYTIEPPPAGAKSSEVRVKTKSFTDAEEPSAEAAGSGQKTTPAPVQKTTPGKPAPGKPEAAKEQKPMPKGLEQYAERCKSLRANLQTLKEHARVKVQDQAGETRILTDDEKNARLDFIQREIRAFCE